MAHTFWEVVDDEGTTERLRVFHGWLVRVDGSNLVFVKDQFGEWDLEVDDIDLDLDGDDEDMDDPSTGELDDVPDDEPGEEIDDVIDDIQDEPAVDSALLIPVYTDSLQSGFRNFSWAVVDLAHADAYKGETAILIEPDRYAALNLQLADGIDVDIYEGVELHIKAMGSGMQQVQLAFAAGQTVIAEAPLNPKFDNGLLPTENFEHVRVTFDEIGLTVGSFDSILVQGSVAVDQEPILVDEIYLVKRAAPRVHTPPPPDDSPLPATLMWLETDGNRLLNRAMGEPVQLRGVNIHDTRSNNSGAYNPPNVANVKRLIDEAKSWGANFVRLCMESYGAAGGRAHWQGVLDDQQYMDDIKEIVRHASEKGMYIETALWVDPTQSQLGWPTDATLPLIAKLTSAMRNNGRWMIGFCNEPQQNYDDARSAEYAAMIAKCIETVRAVEREAGQPEHVVCVQAPAGWARYLDYFVQHPMQHTNVLYECHVYDPASEFASMVEQPSQTLPMFVGEFAPFQASYGSMSDQDCRDLVAMCNRLGIGYCGWAFHHNSPPSMLQTNANQIAASGIPTGQTVPTAWGALMKELLQS